MGSVNLLVIQGCLSAYPTLYLSSDSYLDNLSIRFCASLRVISVNYSFDRGGNLAWINFFLNSSGLILGV